MKTLTDEQIEGRAQELYEIFSEDTLNDLNLLLSGEDPEVDERVRELLENNSRFRRFHHD